MRFGDFFSQLDAYGMPVNFTFNGKQRFQTRIGAFFTLLTVFVVLSYGAFKVVIFVNDERPEIRSWIETAGEIP